MGKKINQKLFRLSTNYLESSWIGGKKKYFDLVYQDKEIKNYLSNLLEENGILGSEIKIKRWENRMELKVDLYFSIWLLKRSKLKKSKILIKKLKSKYKRFSKGILLRDLYKFFLRSGYIKRWKKRKTYSFLKSLRYFKKNKKVKYFESSLGLDLKETKEKAVIKKGWLKKIWSAKRWSREKKERVSLKKGVFSEVFLGSSKKEKRKKSVLFYGLGKKLSKSLQKFTGLEKVVVSFESNQLKTIPLLKVLRRKLLKNLFYEKRKESFNEVFELIYFILTNNSKKGSKLLTKLLVDLLETNRKQSLAFYLVTKIIESLMKNIPSRFLGVRGLKIVVKGRFNKRSRTKKIIFQVGSLSTSKISQSLSYYQEKAVTVYGTFGVKVWLVGKEKL